MALSARIVTDPADLTPLEAGWALLAADAGLPLAGPLWSRAYWHGVEAGSVGLRTVAVHDGEQLVAVAPFFAQFGRLGFIEYRLLGAGVGHRLGVLCRPGREEDVAAAVASVLATTAPTAHTIVWEGIDAADPWPERLGRHLRAPAGVMQRVDQHMPAPIAVLPEGDFEDWLATRSANARSELRRTLRRFEREGGTLRLATPETATTDLDAFVRLHEARWADRGGSHALGPERVRMLRRLVLEGSESGIVRLWMADLGERPIGAGLFVQAGQVLSYWNGGMDPAHERLRPGQLTIIAALRDALARGERRIDFGGGEARYKRRFSDEDHPLVWRTTLLRGVRYPLTRAQLAPKHVRWAARDAAAALPPERRDQLKRLVRRLRATARSSPQAVLLLVFERASS
jgi:CelD/BcsL family acetyltransferase involved in cellulose biosynthesis